MIETIVYIFWSMICTFPETVITNPTTHLPHIDESSVIVEDGIAIDSQRKCVEIATNDKSWLFAISITFPDPVPTSIFCNGTSTANRLNSPVPLLTTSIFNSDETTCCPYPMRKNIRIAV